MPKNVVIDFSYLGVLCGFGNIAENYSRQLAAREVPGMHFTFIVPENYVGSFGQHVDYFRKEHLRQDVSNSHKHIDLWHATTQTFDYRKHSEGTLQLLTIHDLNFLYEKQHIHRWKNLLKLRHRIRQSDAITVISNYVKDDLEKHANVGNKPVQIIYNGVNDLSTNGEQRPAFVKDSTEPFFFTIGQVLKKKGFDSLIPMMHHFPNHKLYICGDTNFPYADTLRSIIDRQGEGRCVLAGRISEAEKAWMYRHCVAFLLASQSEGFGLPVIEAMQMGKPVFLLRATSLPEVGSCYAFYWDHCDDPAYMARVVSQGLSMADERLMAEEQQYAQTFSYERYTNAYIALYQRLLNL